MDFKMVFWGMVLVKKKSFFAIYFAYCIYAFMYSSFAFWLGPTNLFLKGMKLFTQNKTPTFIETRL